MRHLRLHLLAPVIMRAVRLVGDETAAGDGTAGADTIGAHGAGLHQSGTPMQKPWVPIFFDLFTCDCASRKGIRKRTASFSALPGEHAELDITAESFCHVRGRILKFSGGGVVEQKGLGEAIEGLGTRTE